MTRRGKHPFDWWDMLAVSVSMGLMVVGLIGVGAGVILLAERILQ